MKYLVLLLGLILLGLGGYALHITRSLVQEQENNRQLHRVIERQQETLNSIKENYAKIIDFSHNFAKENAQAATQSDKIVQELKELKETKNVAQQTQRINELRISYNKCIESISRSQVRSQVSESCSQFFAPDATQ